LVPVFALLDGFGVGLSAGWAGSFSLSTMLVVSGGCAVSDEEAGLAVFAAFSG
jgi:hypothetical protein